jgi:hypothetical protein
MSASNKIRAAVILLSLSGCFNGSTYTPIISSVVSTNPPPPDFFEFAAVGTGATTVGVSGQFFTSDTVVYWNGRPQVTHYQSPTALTVDIDQSLTLVAGTAQVTAQSDGSFLSAPYTADIVDSEFTLTAVAPQPLAVGASGATLTLTGTGFKPTSQILWNGSALQTTFVSSTSITAALPAALLAAAGDNLVKVTQTFCDDFAHCQPDLRTILASVGTSTRNSIRQFASDIVWDATHSLLFAATITPDGSSRAITAIDPVTTELGTSLLAPETGQLSISDQDQFLYGPDSTTAAVRYPLPGLANPTTISATGTVSFVAAAPGAPSTFAFFDFSKAGVADGAVVRTKTVSSTDLLWLTWGFDTSTLYGISETPGILVFNVDQTGITQTGTLLSGTSFTSGTTLTFDRTLRRIYSSKGDNIDEQSHDSRPFPLVTPAETFNLCQVAIDSALNKAFFACNEDTFGLTVSSFDLQTQQQISRIVLSADVFPGEAMRIVRWGSNGLAVASSSAIYIYSGQFVE